MTTDTLASGYEHPPEAIEAAEDLLDRRPCWKARAQMVAPSGVRFHRCRSMRGHAGPCNFLPREEDTPVLRAQMVGDLTECLRDDGSPWKDDGFVGRRFVARHLLFWQWRVRSGELSR